ncbi:MAG: MBL fold metallo-hydrolase [Nitrospirota bacterium]
MAERSDFIIFKPYYLDCLAHASYLIGDEATKLAAVIDPQRDIDHYVNDAEAIGLHIRYVFLTHFHADFLAGHLELRERTGAEIYLGAKAQAEYAFFPVEDGDVVEFGQVRFHVLETPGHTLEAISILLYDLARDDRKPYAVFTGDTLFIGDVGRPDLMVSQGVSADELAGWLYDSLHTKLLALPDDTLVYPSHGAGSMCGRNLSEKRVSTIGTQRRHNYALQPMNKAAFVKLVTTNQPEAPQYFRHAAEFNRLAYPILEQAVAALKPLSVEVVLEAQRNGVQLLDVREPADFAGAHLCSSLNIALGGRFATRAARGPAACWTSRHRLSSSPTGAGARSGHTARPNRIRPCAGVSGGRDERADKQAGADRTDETGHRRGACGTTHEPPAAPRAGRAHRG